MQQLTYAYLNQGLSRRDFMQGLLAMGMTGATAATVIGGVDAMAAPDNGYRTVTGTGGDLLVAQARSAGVEYLFTNPGSFEVGFFDAFVDTPGLQLIMGLHEGLVISMADGYHKVTGKPAFVNVHVIAGTAQMAGQLYNAHRDGSALVITAGLLDNEIWSDDVLLAPRPGYNQKDINHQFTKMSWEAKRPESIPLMLRRAFKVATTQPGGPVYLAIPNYALEAQNIQADILPGSRYMWPMRIPPDESLVDKAAQMLAEATNPVLVFGDEVWKSNAQLEAVHLAELLGAAATVDRGAFANFPVQHPLYTGRYNVNNQVLTGGGDVLLVVGARLGGNSVPSKPAVSRGARIIQLGLDVNTMGRNLPVDIGLISDARTGLRAVIDAVKDRLTNDRLAQSRIDRTARLTVSRQAQQDKARAAALNGAQTTPMQPAHLGDALEQMLDSDAIIVSENLTGNYETCDFGYRSDQKMWLTNTGLGLGWGIGAATGAKLGMPNRQVVCSIGDGSVMYSAAGFWTQTRYNIPVLTVVWNNQNYQTVRLAYHRYQGKMTKSGHYTGMYLGDPNIDFAGLARSQGVEGEKVENASQLVKALQRGINATREGRPYLLDVQVSRIGGGAGSVWYQRFSLADKRSRRV